MRAIRIAGIGMVVAGVLSIAGAGPAAARAGAGGCPLPRFGPGRDYHPHIDAARFSSLVDNAWFPLRVGTTWLYAGRRDGQAVVDVVKATRHTRMIDGVRTRVVADRLFAGGRLAERTSDYFAQDACGNVWYFGEDTAELDEHGRVTSRDGTWHAGVDGAEPGVVMQAHPQLDRRFRQEWYAGSAEDTFSVRDRTARVTVPAGTYTHALRTAEHSRLEPNVIDNKYYVRGIGEVQEIAVHGPQERLGLVEVLR
ncbi:MAG: hypothetical protein QOI15_2269 [Pseudonocardiales bacterium]|nr:hypothetical protein [Pseudonocardiales bacterium]